MTGTYKTLDDYFDSHGFVPNEEQRKAIEHVDGPLFLVAGPGSGKTRVLLWRTFNLIVFCNVKPRDIFLSTFTEKAARQLKDGLLTLLASVKGCHFDTLGNVCWDCAFSVSSYFD